MASITERSGTYFIMVSVGYDSYGKQIRKTMSWKPKEAMTAKQIEKAVNEQAILFEKKVLSGQVMDGNITFAEFTERWCSDYAENQLAPKTYARYKSMLKRILPEIGHLKLNKIQPHHIMGLYKKLSSDVNRRGISFLPTEKFMEAFEKKGYTMDYLSEISGLHVNTVYKIFKNIPIAEPTATKLCDVLGLHFYDGVQPAKPLTYLSNKTIRHHHRLISSILNQGVFWQVIPSNPAQRVKSPKVERSEAKYLDEKQTARLLELLEGESIQHRTIVKMFIYSGLRRGEMCGLEWKDIDFENNLIRVRRSSQYVSGKGVFTKETKTLTSDRTIKLPKQAFEILKDYRVWQLGERLRMGDLWQDKERVFTRSDGGTIHPDSITGWFRHFISKSDLPQITIHSLRHTNITLQIAAGVPLRTVSKRAGHSQPGITMSLYTHALQSQDERAAELLEDILKPREIHSNTVCPHS